MEGGKVASPQAFIMLEGALWASTPVRCPHQAPPSNVQFTQTTKEASVELTQFTLVILMSKAHNC